MASILLTNARIVDGTAPERGDPVQVLIENDRIREVGKSIASAKAKVIDLGGRTLMPGLIDAHVHVVACLADLGRNAMLPDAVTTV
ncbi:amidohydrolase family protein, partial [Enterobacter hormaechei]|uniref:amidohydrolase family protein n=1 Tax=Enterobacter hormaechei TaxID=158836 RepID=UPI0013D72371